MCFWRLGYHSISARSDEVIYVRVTQSMLQNGDFFSPKHGKIPFYSKPPLKMWLALPVLQVLGESNFSYRLIDALCGVMVVLVTALIGASVLGSQLTGILAGFFLLSSPILLTQEHSFRKAVLDGLLLLLGTGSLWVGFRAVEKLKEGKKAHNDAFAFALLIAAGVLTKSVAGFIPVLIVGLFFLSSSLGREAIWKNRRLVIGSLFLAFVIPALYFVPHALLSSHARNEFFFVEIYNRITQGYAGHNTGSPFFYINALLFRKHAFTTYLLLPGLIFALFLARRDKRYRFLFIWALLPVILYSFSSSKAPWYITLSFPAFALLSASFVLAIVQRTALISRQPQRLLAFFGLAAYSAICLISLARSYERIIMYIEKNESNRIPFDTLVEEVLSTPGLKVAIYKNAISGRANPINGQFNLEGFYRMMLKDRVIAAAKADDLSDALRNGVGLVIMRSADLQDAPAGLSEKFRFPPFQIREDELVVLAKTS